MLASTCESVLGQDVEHIWAGCPPAAMHGAQRPPRARSAMRAARTAPEAPARWGWGHGVQIGALTPMTDRAVISPQSRDLCQLQTNKTGIKVRHQAACREVHVLPGGLHRRVSSTGNERAPAPSPQGGFLTQHKTLTFLPDQLVLMLNIGET